jgi:hypothetical protein
MGKIMLALIRTIINFGNLGIYSVLEKIGEVRGGINIEIFIGSSGWEWDRF